jgi:kynureninase
VLLTGYLEWLLKSQVTSASSQINIITPSNARERGCQLSLQTKSNGKRIFDKLTKAGVIADWREPDVIRIAPVPMYNSFEDVWRFADILRTAAAH